MSWIGRMSMPGLSMRLITQEMPLCFGASGSVRTSTCCQSANRAQLVQIFEPVTIKVSPSIIPRVFSAARSEPAAGSGKALAPDHFALENGGQVGLFLLLVAAGDDGWPREIEAVETVVITGRATARVLHQKDPTAGTYRIPGRRIPWAS